MYVVCRKEANIVVDLVRQVQDDVNVFPVPQWFGYVFFVGGIRRETGHDGVVGADFFQRARHDDAMLAVDGDSFA